MASLRVLESVRDGPFSGDLGLTEVRGSTDPFRSSSLSSHSLRFTGTSAVLVPCSPNVGVTEASTFAPSCIGMEGVTVLASGSEGCIIGQYPRALGEHAGIGRVRGEKTAHATACK